MGSWKQEVRVGNFLFLGFLVFQIQFLLQIDRVSSLVLRLRIEGVGLPV